MGKTTISVIQAARNFSDGVNRPHYQNMTFVLPKNGSPVARLVPDQEKVCLGRDLAEMLVGLKLTGEESSAWQSDLEAARKNLQAQADKWQ